MTCNDACAGEAEGLGDAAGDGAGVADVTGPFELPFELPGCTVQPIANKPIKKLNSKRRVNEVIVFGSLLCDL